MATYRLWRERGGAGAAAMAGHSLGEFSALVAAGCLEFKAAVELVKFRAEAMQAAVPEGEGAMAALLGLEDADVEAACAEAAPRRCGGGGEFQCPRPGGDRRDGRRRRPRHSSSTAAKGARRALRLAVSVPSHSSLMLPAAERLRERLALTPISPSKDVAVFGVDVKIHGSADQIRAALVRQLHTPVFWAATVRSMIASGATRIIECGPGRVLTGLNRRIDKNRDLSMMALEDRKSVDEALALVNGEP